jgi:ECF transporter S component (folate family)
MKKTRIIVFMGLLVAMNIVLERFLSIQTPIVRISFGFLPIALAGALFGPVGGAVAGGLSDILGTLVAGQGGYFPGFTLTAVLGGAVYGFFLYKKPASVKRTALAVLIITVVCNIALNTLWLTVLTGKGALAILPPRLVKDGILLPVQVFLIYSVQRLAQPLGIFRSAD